MKFAQSKGRASAARSSRNATPRGRAARTSGLPTIRSVALYTAFAWASLTAATAMADVTITNPDATPNDNPEADLSIQAKPTSQWTGVWNRGNLLGDIGGLRPWLGKYGVTFALTETSEYLYNTRGGLNTGGTYDGLTTATVQLDTRKAFGLPGGLFNVSALNIHGQNLSADNLGTLNTASGIEAQDTTRLWELWYQQSFLNNKMDVKVGQQSLDQEFMVSQSAGLFVNTMFGWPALPSYDMPSGGPAYPLADLGVRFRGQITTDLDRARRRVRRRPARQQSEQHQRHEFQPAYRRAVYRRTAVRVEPAGRRRDGRGRQHRPAWQLQDRLLVQHRQLRRPALRQHRFVAGEPQLDRRCPAASRRLQFLCSGRSDGMASRPGRDRAASTSSPG